MPTKKPVQFLRPDFTDAARHHIEEYLNADFPDHARVMTDLVKLYAFSDKLIFSEYEKQCQVSAFFTNDDTGEQFGVSGLGQTVDLAILSCFVKCEFTLQWKFVSSGDADSSTERPKFA